VMTTIGTPAGNPGSSDARHVSTVLVGRLSA
jgi:hypothetical protein